MATLNLWEEFSRQAGADRRKHPRITLAVPIQVSGLDQSGEFFTENNDHAEHQRDRLPVRAAHGWQLDSRCGADGEHRAPRCESRAAQPPGALRSRLG